MNLAYLKSFLYGIAFGIPFCLAVGPVFFFLIQAGVNKGLKYALAIAFGVVLADIALINTTYFFIDTIRSMVVANYFKIEWVCILVLLGMGIYTLIREVKVYDTELVIGKTAFMFFINGFILDAFNPSNIFVWMGVNAKIIKYNNTEHLLFYSASIITITLLMILLGILSAKIKSRMNPKILTIVNRITGAIYIILSITILFNVHKGHYPVL